MIAILSAIEGEIKATAEALEQPVNVSFAGRRIYTGELAGKKVVVGYTGVGKALAALTVQGVIDRYGPTALIFVGIAGSLNTLYEIGDVVIAADCVQHDFDATRFGFPRGELSGENIFELASDTELADYALCWKRPERKFHSGRILSGDQFITSAGEAATSYLIDELEGDAVDMESAAASLAAYLNGIPFLVMRVVSDKGDGTLPKGFKRFLKNTSELIKDFACYMVTCPAI